MTRHEQAAARSSNIDECPGNQTAGAAILSVAGRGFIDARQISLSLCRFVFGRM